MNAKCKMQNLSADRQDAKLRTGHPDPEPREGEGSRSLMCEILRLLRSLRMTLVVSFLILHFTFLISAQPVMAAEEQFSILPYCFRADECVSDSYKGIPAGCRTQAEYRSNKACALQTAECTGTAQPPAAITRGYTANCYAPPPTVKLQISILGQEVQGLENYLSNLYRYLVGIVGIVAGVMIVWAGVKWLTSGGNPERIADAKKKIGNAMIGLVLVLGAYVLLQTLNPALVALQPPPVKMARRVTEVKELKCEDIREFPCGGRPTELIYMSGTQTIPANVRTADNLETGEYLCSKSGDDAYNALNPCEDSPQAQCQGIYCSSGGCWEVKQDRILPAAQALVKPLRVAVGTGSVWAIDKPPRGCFARSECANCTLPIEVTPGSTNVTAVTLRNLRLCASAACDCLVAVKTNDADQEVPFCTKRRQKGQSCKGSPITTPQPELCQTDLLCVPTVAAAGWTGFECNTKGADGKYCLNNAQCQSGVCRMFGMSTPDNRTPIGQCEGTLNGSPCASGRCAAGLRCVDYTISADKCSDGRTGSPCKETSDCNQGLRCQDSKCA